jgi:hypothetical protein
VNGDTYSANKGRAYDVSGSYVHMPAVADVTGDGKPEFIAGNTAYHVHINANRAIPNAGSLSVYRTCPTLTDLTDGYTVVCDINGDGKLDVFVSSGGDISNDTHYVFGAWDINTNATGTLIAQSGTSNSQAKTDFSLLGPPFIGNIDDTPGVEMCMASKASGNNTNIHGWGFTATGSNGGVATGTFARKYAMTAVAPLGGIGISMFDFTNDGKAKLVFRDAANIRVVEPSGGTFTDLFSTPATSQTWHDYPVIADIDNSGTSSILTVAGNNSNNSSGQLRIYKSSKLPWAPSRAVWNQFAYNVVNINNDLTLPSQYFDIATVFPGQDGILYTGDDVQPFNNFLQQQTFLDMKGNSIWLVPDAQINSAVNYTYYQVGDSIVITGSFDNTGEASLVAPIYVTAYKNQVLTGNAIGQSVITANVDESKSASFKIKVPNFVSLQPVNNIIVRVNDNGNAKFVLPECDTTNNATSLTIFIPNDDAATVLQNQSVEIDLFANDMLGACATYQLQAGDIAMQSTGVTGTFAVVNNKLVYTAPDHYPGSVVELKYTITCAGETKSAKVYVHIIESCNGEFFTCKNAPYQMCLRLDNPAGTKYEWFNASNVSTGFTPPLIAHPVNGETFTVQPTLPAASPYAHINFPKATIKMRVIDNCDTGPLYRMPNKN